MKKWEAGLNRGWLREKTTHNSSGVGIGTELNSWRAEHGYGGGVNSIQIRKASKAREATMVGNSIQIDNASDFRCKSTQALDS